MTMTIDIPFEAILAAGGAAAAGLYMLVGALVGGVTVGLTGRTTDKTLTAYIVLWPVLIVAVVLVAALVFMTHPFYLLASAIASKVGEE
jgi:hypothetical protein